MSKGRKQKTKYTYVPGHELEDVISDYKGFGFMKQQRKRPQSPKPLTAGRNEKFNEAMRELGRSNATRPIPSGKAYKRKSKHREW